MLPYPSPRHSIPVSSSLSASTFIHKADLIPIDISVPELLQFIQTSNRVPEEDTTVNGCYVMNSEILKYEAIDRIAESKNIGEDCNDVWRKFIATFGFLVSAKDAPSVNLTLV